MAECKIILGLSWDTCLSLGAISTAIAILLFTVAMYLVSRANDR